MKFVMVGLLLTLFTSAAFSATAQQITKPAKKTDAAESDPVFHFNGKLEFEGKVVRGSIRKSEIDALLTRRVVLPYAPSDETYGLGFSFQEGHFPVFSCQEWVQARAQDLSGDLNTIDRGIESSFVDTCSFLLALKGAKAARRSFIANPRVGLSNLNLLPANVLESLSGEASAEIDRLNARGVRVSHLVAKREAKVLKNTKNSVELEYDLEMRLKEIGRADFDGDGIEDIFVASAKFGPTFRYFDYFILTRPNASAGFTVKQPDWLALGKDSAALSAGIDLKSSQLKKVKISRQGLKEDWPFEVDEGELACANVGSVAVFFMTNGNTYALNAWAKNSKIDGQPVSLDMDRYPRAYAIFNQAFAMCQTKGEK